MADKEFDKGFAHRFNEALHAHETYRDWSDVRLGKEFGGVSGPTVWNWRRGQLPKITNAVLIAKKLNVSIDWLMLGVGQRIPDPILYEYSQLPDSAKQEVKAFIAFKRFESTHKPEYQIKKSQVTFKVNTNNNH